MTNLCVRCNQTGDIGQMVTVANPYHNGPEWIDVHPPRRCRGADGNQRALVLPAELPGAAPLRRANDD